jgi:hypothetical protein
LCNAPATERELKTLRTALAWTFPFKLALWLALRPELTVALWLTDLLGVLCPATDLFGALWTAKDRFGVLWTAKDRFTDRFTDRLPWEVGPADKWDIAGLALI